MTPVLSLNTRAILLLTAPLITGRDDQSAELLSPGEYKRLARHLRDMQNQPADLLSPGTSDLLSACRPVVDESRLQRLLGRGFLLSQVIEHWQARAIWVVSRADSEYPRRMKARLREDAPAVLYGCGDIRLLETGGLAVVGSRQVDQGLIDYAMALGRLAANAGKTIVSGGAKGIDQAAMRGALETGGKAIGVLSDSLERTAMDREHRNLLMDGTLVLVSPYDPKAGFSVGNAMQRNKYIYALADASMVVNSDFNKGGTWAGAAEQLDKLHFVPVYVRSTGETSKGVKALRGKGALPWPDPQDAAAFMSVFESKLPGATGDDPRLDMPLFAQEKEEAKGDRASESLFLDPPDGMASLDDRHESGHPCVLGPGEELFATARIILLRILETPMKDAELSAELGVSTQQIRMWLQRLVEEGVVEKQNRPAGWVVKQHGFFQ
ncbi:MAG: DNA-processing protein DprA [Geothrix sp.]|nr:DNA-processing protein DprA [Geothrix sp.]